MFEKLKEPSTIRGLIALAAVAGIGVSPEQVNAILTVAGLAYGLFQVVRKERQNE
jgi:hypothetical protein